MEAGSRRERGGRFGAVLLALLAAAVASRFFRLGTWPLFGDEIYTLQDSAEFTFSLHGRPLLYWLNHQLVRPLLGLDAFGLRLLPAVFGVLGVGAVAEIGRRLVGTRAALLAGLLVVLSPWHLEMSQYARYYTLVFLLAAVSPAALYLGVREGSARWIAAGIAATALGWFAHPTAVLPAAGFLVWLAGYAVLRTGGRRRRLLLGVLAAAALGGLAAGVALLDTFASVADWSGIGGVALALSYGVRIGAGPALAAAAGVALLWIDGRRELALFLAAAAGVPLALLAVLGELVPVHTGYLFATAPFALLAAGAFLDGTIRRVDGRTSRIVVGGAAAALVVATGLPSFVSHYVDGGKADFREPARHIASRAGPSDVVLAEHTGPFWHYARALDARPLRRDTARMDSLRGAAARSSPPGVLWVVPYLHSSGGFGLAGLGDARGWVWRNCRLALRDDPVRIDHVRNIVEVWRCPAEGVRASASGPPGEGAGRRDGTDESEGANGARSAP